MSDFVFSKQNIESERNINAIKSIYERDKPTVHEYHGSWGSLAISKNLYNGFEPYENERYLVCVIGGPLLTFHDNHFLNIEESYEGTEVIFNRWIEGKMKWDEDLSGPFVVLIINKQTSETLCVTDMMSFIPVYSFSSSSNFMLSTHVDILAKVSKQSNNIDIISELDFILHGMITYPYTSYKNIYQIPPASEHKITLNESGLKSTYYWLPKEESEDLSINEASIYLRNSIKEYINNIASVSTNIAQFISGGEDSRLLSAMLQKHNRDAFIFLDHMNREGKIAQKVTRTYGGNFKLYTRDPLHYLYILPACSDLVGSGSQYHHAHTYGFHKKCKLNTYDAVFGGLFADALLKGARIRKIRLTGSLPFIPEMKNKKYSATHLTENPIFNQDALFELTSRRQSRLDYVSKLRDQSAEEWFELWPSSMNRNIPNVHANRRLFSSYEPFLSNEVVKLSATIPQKWKLNRKLFHKMAKPLLKPTKWISHGKGWYPYYSWIVKSITYPFTGVFRKCLRITGINKGVQGPWGDWNMIVSSNDFYQAIQQHNSSINKLENIFKDKNISNILHNHCLNNQQKVNLLQALYMRK